MRGDSSGSASDPQGAEGLPLIWCTDCKSRQVVRRVSQKPWSADQVFYCCPKYKRDGTGCPFWHWEDDYADLLVGKRAGIEAGKGTLVGGHEGNKSNAGRSMVQGEVGLSGRTMVEGELGMSGAAGMMNREYEIVAMCKEIVSLVKAITLVSVCIVFVLMLNLIVQLVK